MFDHDRVNVLDVLEQEVQRHKGNIAILEVNSSAPSSLWRVSDARSAGSREHTEPSRTRQENTDTSSGPGGAREVTGARKCW